MLLTRWAPKKNTLFFSTRATAHPLAPGRRAAPQDELEDIAKEYHSERQTFNDERGEGFEGSDEDEGTGKKAPARGKDAVNPASANMIDRAILAARKVRSKDMGEEDKQAIVTQLLERMDEVTRRTRRHAGCCCLSHRPPLPLLMLLPLRKSASYVAAFARPRLFFFFFNVRTCDDPPPSLSLHLCLPPSPSARRQAWRRDMDALTADPPRPAVHKLAMLDSVAKILSQRSLHETLLEFSVRALEK